MEKSEIDKVTEKDKPEKLSLFKNKSELTLGDRVKNFFLRFFAISFWTYVLLKVFFVDLDRLFLDMVAIDFNWILNYKFIVFLIVLTTTWWLIGTRDFIFWTIYILAYPLIILLFKIPYTIWKQKSWVFAFSVVNFIFGFFINFKYRITIFTIFITSFVFALVSSNIYALSVSVLFLLLVTFTVFIKSFIDALKPSKIFTVYMKLSTASKDFSKKNYTVNEEIRALNVQELNKKQLESRVEGLQNSVVYNRVCLVIANKLNEFQKSDWRILPSVFSLLSLILFTVICFFGIYYSLYKINPTYFAVTEQVSWFDFFYFSFNNLVFNQIGTITANHWISQTIIMAQYLLNLIIPLFLVTIYISHKTQKQSSELDEVINTLKEDAVEIETFINEEYEFNSLDEAINHLLEMNASLGKFIQSMTRLIP